MQEIEIRTLNVYAGCDGRCENCERFFECKAPARERFSKKGVFASIEENTKSLKYKIAVLGGKGGVGKSMLAVNLAAALAIRGRKVCILDQVYDCPAIPVMTGIPEGAKFMIGDNGMIPVESPHHGVKVVSTGLVMDRDDAIIWFHDMKRNATEELLSSVDYGNIDYLVIDVPAGTSSETVNVLKYVPNLNGALVITVPSEVSQNVARKCIYVLRKAGIPIIGVVENMAEASCPHCGSKSAIIQSGAGERMAAREGIPYLGKVPISYEMSLSLDEGEPFVVRYPGKEETKLFLKIADTVINQCEDTEKQIKVKASKREGSPNEP